MRRVLLVGATSSIAEATARRLAAAGARLFLVARNADKLRAIADDLRLRGAAQVETYVMDATEYDRHAAMLAAAEEALGGLETALIAHGSLPDQKACEASFKLTRGEIETNALSVISLLTHLANRFEQQRHGTIAVISSVAGDRGRQSNYVYGTAKGAVTLFLQGLRNRLHPAGVRVITIKPGFVDTPMTVAFPKGALWVSPDVVARAIVSAIEKGKDVLYTPWFWRPIMFCLRAIPAALFKRLRL